MALMKSRVNELRVFSRLARNGELSFDALKREVERIQIDLYAMSATPKKVRRRHVR